MSELNWKVQPSEKFERHIPHPGMTMRWPILHPTEHPWSRGCHFLRTQTQLLSMKRYAASMRSNVQWYAPWIAEGGLGGNVVESLKVPLRIASTVGLVGSLSIGRRGEIWNTYDVALCWTAIKFPESTFFYNMTWARTTDVELASTVIDFCNVEKGKTALDKRSAAF